MQHFVRVIYLQRNDEKLNADVCNEILLLMCLLVLFSDVGSEEMLNTKQRNQDEKSPDCFSVTLRCPVALLLLSRRRRKSYLHEQHTNDVDEENEVQEY